MPAPKFDFQRFTMATLESAAKSVRPEALQALQGSQKAAKALLALSDDTNATLVAIQSESDPKRLAGLQRDLETTLPARKAAILSAVESELASDAKAALDHILTVVIQAVVIAAKAFIH